MSKGRQVRRAATFLYVCLAARVLPGLTAVNGVVTDSTGAVVPGVAVTITNSTTKLTRTGTTNDTGFYSVSQLLPGNYTVRAEREGFKAGVVRVSLPVNEIVTLNLALEFGVGIHCANGRPWRRCRTRQWGASAACHQEREQRAARFALRVLSYNGWTAGWPGGRGI